MLRFADCTLDLGARRLLRREHETHLSPKAFDLLKTLVDHRDRALTKAELLERVWPGVFVSEASLARVVSNVRKAIGDRPEAPIIRTVHGYGYAFVAMRQASRPGPGAADTSVIICWIIWSDRSFPLRDGERIVGRELSMSVWLDSPKLS